MVRRRSGVRFPAPARIDFAFLWRLQLTGNPTTSDQLDPPLTLARSREEPFDRFTMANPFESETNHTSATKTLPHRADVVPVNPSVDRSEEVGQPVVPAPSVTVDKRYPTGLVRRRGNRESPSCRNRSSSTRPARSSRLRRPRHKPSTLVVRATKGVFLAPGQLGVGATFHVTPPSEVSTTADDTAVRWIARR